MNEGLGSAISLHLRTSSTAASALIFCRFMSQ
eukprot:CAMPEP_0184400954 /NCGR_PEP_ID=MMETSP0007-20130409/77042_1 /TAXON_ID=97485 /ORGANISM="Prymnesium parvum, Strain Texoma1" /LENGTH=31 /DNA_ID= /DNA_START= /DNA_END= /DNA_ORIENTATION=